MPSPSTASSTTSLSSVLHKHDQNMFKFVLVSALFGIACCRPGFLQSGGLSLSGSGGLGGLHAGSLNLDSGSSGSYSGIDSYSASHGGGGGGGGGGSSSGGSSGGDFHHGVSIVGGGGDGGHGTSFDLTHHAGNDHAGQIYGGTFISSAKYEGGHGGNSGGGDLGGYGGLGGHGLGGGGGYGVHETEYSDVLGASDSLGGGQDSGSFGGGHDLGGFGGGHY